MMGLRRGNPVPFLDVLIFDMDGVLIDVSKSYRKTIQKTVQIYLATCLGMKGCSQKLALDEAISFFKSAGGFNNDWDLTSGLLFYLLSISGLPPASKRKRFSSIPEVFAYLRTKSEGRSFKIPTFINSRHLSSFLEKAKALGRGLKGIRQLLKGSWEGWVYRSGDLDRENLVKRIFQEVYLGREFKSYYHLHPLFYREKGYYLRERMLIPKAVLSALRKKIRLGIASGRPRFEAELALKRFHLLPYFDSIVTLDECLEEEGHIFRSTGKRINCLKPHPFSLLRAVRDIGISNARCGYVGDVVDDILTARAAKGELSILAIGFISGASHRIMEKALRHAGADLVIRHPKEFLQLVKNPPSPAGGTGLGLG
ncbi:MAG TPA: HAD family hydrolase [Thermodesulfobacteriota bacterium]|nr:HAD family hydrolase [Thermodesulfobacteriota bacterium]